ncbi:MAG: heavy metal translocating P-type ATPase, partial [Candidatus Zixiibacteriota bacterium]
QQLADRVAAVFVPAVLGVAVLTLIGWLVFAPDSPLIVRSVVAVLIIACPCALGLATPTAVLVATGRAAREGIIIKGGDVLERVNKVDAVIFDKTGTLTFGQLEVVAVKGSDKWSPKELVRLAGSVEAQSEHPVARAIVRHLKTMGLQTAPVTDSRSYPGFGMTAEVAGHKVIVGSRTFLQEQGIDPNPFRNAAEEEMNKGRTVVFAAIDGRMAGMIALADRIRPEARDVIGHLKSHLRLVTMLSGDNRPTAEGVAHSLGLDSFEAEIKPDQKLLFVESYRKAGYTVAMVGDGINDAPALAAADIGIAVGSGTDVAIETGDVVLIRPELTGLEQLFSLSRA